MHLPPGALPGGAAGDAGAGPQLTYRRMTSSSPADAGRDPLEGYFLGSYGSHGDELLHLQRGLWEGRDAIIAHKITGNPPHPSRPPSSRPQRICHSILGVLRACVRSNNAVSAWFVAEGRRRCTCRCATHPPAAVAAQFYCTFLAVLRCRGAVRGGVAWCLLDAQAGGRAGGVLCCWAAPA